MKAESSLKIVQDSLKNQSKHLSLENIILYICSTGSVRSKSQISPSRFITMGSHKDTKRSKPARPEHCANLRNGTRRAEQHMLNTCWKYPKARVNILLSSTSHCCFFVQNHTCYNVLDLRNCPGCTGLSWKSVWTDIRECPPNQSGNYGMYVQNLPIVTFTKSFLLKVLHAYWLSSQPLPL
jgi:hypothetical protein